jgi:hypothetical protein
MLLCYMGQRIAVGPVEDSCRPTFAARGTIADIRQLDEIGLEKVAEVVDLENQMTSRVRSRARMVKLKLRNCCVRRSCDFCHTFSSND